MKKLLFIIVVLAVALISCSQRVPYSVVDNIEDGWHKDSVHTFSINVDDTTTLYELDIVLRNTNDFPDQNLWLQVECVNPNDSLHIDTLNIFLADEFGRWRGRGIGSHYNNLILYQDSMQYAQTGVYEYRVKHLMRHTKLDGLTQIGVQLMKK
ncbi:MAG: gliding motility lipoprotein GldH [Bacteroidales bacterium]|nr:gliding motility lipoprotein GldH [Bacteroidales bacterium]